MSELTVRRAAADLLDEVIHTFGAAFLRDTDSDEDREWFGQEFDPERFLGVFDGDDLAGTAAILTRDMTLPTTGPKPVAAVTTVAVKPWYRRRGAATMLMRAQLHGLHDEGGESFAALWASEGSIYSRFGYGVAGNYMQASISHAVPFRAGIDIGKHRVRELRRAEATPLVNELYEQIAPDRVGWLSRDKRSWAMHLWDTPSHRKGSSSYRFALHPDGYAIFRTTSKWGDRGPEGELDVHELVAANPVASAALWRYLLDYDQVRTVTARLAPDEPVFLMLQDPRQAVRRHVDSLWVRLVDVDRALTERGYSAPLDTVFELTDVFCPWNQGRWRLVVDASGAASVERSTGDPELVLDVTDLGAVFLGGTRLTDLAAAGRVTEVAKGAVTRMSRTFLGDQAPHCLEVF
jgi:predicted acetyltransferase